MNVAIEEEFEALPQRLWVKVVEAVNLVLDGNKYYGFAHFAAWADPSIDVILVQAQLVEQMLDLVINSKVFENERQSLFTIENCKQSIHLIQRTHASLKNGDEDEYKSCISKLTTQRKF